MEFQFQQWRHAGGGDPAESAEARRALDHLVEHAPEEWGESMLNEVRLHREILEAWAERGEKAEGQG